MVFVSCMHLHLEGVLVRLMTQLRGFGCVGAMSATYMGHDVCSVLSYLDRIIATNCNMYTVSIQYLQ